LLIYDLPKNAIFEIVQVDSTAPYSVRKKGVNEYPFGMEIKERTWSDSSYSYRFGFNGMESDDEVSGGGNSYTAEFWQYDTRLGRRFNVDPLIKAWESTYATFSNNPVYFVDQRGLTATNKEGGNDPEDGGKGRSSPGMTGDGSDINIKIGEIGRFDKGQAASSHTGLEPKSKKGKEILSESEWDGNFYPCCNYSTPLENRSNESLLGLMFSVFPNGEFSTELEARFRLNNGGEFTHVNNNGLPYGTSFSKIQNSVKEGIGQMLFQNQSMWDISKFIKYSYLQPFTDNPDYAIPIGGIQKVTVEVHSIKFVITPEALNANGSYTPASCQFDANVTIIIWDIFGVDEDDFVNSDIATFFGGSSLAAFWVLQHQRGYQPLIVKLVNKNVIISGSSYKK
jgi:RHS repeat-associated protein